MMVGVVKETYPGERRVALVPASVPPLMKAGAKVAVEAGAGIEAGFPDRAYEEAGARLVDSRAGVFDSCDVVCQVRTLGANPEYGTADLDLMRGADTTLVGLAEPLTDVGPIQTLAGAGVTSFALELMPRITRAQSMDVLSSQATISGYKAVVLAASVLPRMMPMMMTAAGTIVPAKVFVIGAGVAGLQAIASARRMGAVVHGYDIRPVVREQVESLGAKFVELELEAKGSEDKGGYAKAMDADFYMRQQELMAEVVAESDVVITTAAVPGKKSPVLVTADMVKRMSPGSIIVDLAAERGGNCELACADETVVEHGVTIMGPTNLPATVPFHASQMFARNVQTFLDHLMDDDGVIQIDLEDEITVGTLLTRGGDIVQPRVCEILGLEVPCAPAGKVDDGGGA